MIKLPPINYIRLLPLLAAIIVAIVLAMIIKNGIAKDTRAHDGTCDVVMMQRWDKDSVQLNGWRPCTDEEYLTIINNRKNKP